MHAEPISQGSDSPHFGLDSPILESSSLSKIRSALCFIVPVIVGFCNQASPGLFVMMLAGLSCLRGAGLMVYSRLEMDSLHGGFDRGAAFTLAKQSKTTQNIIHPHQ